MCAKTSIVALCVSILAVKRTPDDPNFVRQVEIECTFN